MKLARLLGVSLVILVVGTTLDAQVATKDKGDKTDGKEIVGKVVSVDVDKSTVTINVDGKQQTFTVNPDTEIVGPQGGKSTTRLKDDRFGKGMEISVYAGKDPKVASKIELDYRPKAVPVDVKDKSPVAKDKDKEVPKDKDAPKDKDKDKTAPKDKDKTTTPPKDKDKTTTPPKDKTTTTPVKDKTPPKDKK